MTSPPMCGTLATPRAASGRLRSLAAILGVAIWGTAICLHYGRIGYHPVDSSIVFDGAWRLLSGQLPFRDYHTPSGVTPIVMQAAFFEVLGVNWFAYCLHASLVNGLFCVLAYVLVRSLEGSRLVAAFTALGSGVTFYPPQGVPFMDQHAFFFTLLSVVLAVRACQATGRSATALWALVAPALALGYLSKQIPTVFALPVIVLLWATWGRDRARGAIAFSTGGLLTVASLSILARTLSVPLRRFHYEYDVVPFSVGASRASADAGVLGLGGALLALLRALDLWSLDLLVVASVLWCAVVALGIGRRLARRDPWRVPGWPEGGPEGGPEGLLATSFVGMCLLFARLTNNDAPECVPLVFAAFGLGWVGLVRWSGKGDTVRLLGVALLLIGVRDADTFHREVNVARSTIGAHLTEEEAPELLPPALSYLRFRVPGQYRNASGKSLGEVVRFFEANPGNFMLVGDDSILYGLTGRPSVFNALWFHPGLTIPPRKSRESGPFHAELARRLDRYHVRYVVIEGKQTWMEESLSQLPTVRALIQMRGGPIVMLGPFAIIEIVPPAGEGS